MVGSLPVQDGLVRRARSEVISPGDEQYRLLVDAVVDYAIYMLDPNGRVSSWNSGARRLKGYGAAEIIGEHFSRFYTDDDRASGLPQRGLAAATRDGRFENEGWRVRKDGTRFWASVVIDAVRDDNGTLLGFAKVTRDITERRDAQLALEEAREALFHSQKMEALGRLTGGIAHDFNNLLTAILGSLELLRQRMPQSSSADELRLVDNAMQAGERGAWLTRRMLAFARRQDLELRPVDLIALVRGMTDLLQRSLGPAVTIQTRFAARLPNVMADPNQLELALLNLAMNARDAMPDGGPVVLAAREETVASGGLMAPGRYVCFSVIDQGIGMDETTLARATEPFFTTKGPGKGTGLGLSMVHGVAEQSAGRLALRSRKGEGTTAELWLRAADGTSAPQGEASTHRPETKMRPLTVLAVDDDALVLMSTALMLEGLGHTVLSATSATQALEILRRGQSVDLVVTDEAMPQMRGSQLAEAVRAERPGLPIILATGYAEPRAGEDAKLPRLEKPFSQGDLGRMVDEVMRSRSG
jgi:PAS domain S-box-containing protein